MHISCCNDKLPVEISKKKGKRRWIIRGTWRSPRKDRATSKCQSPADEWNWTAGDGADSINCVLGRAAGGDPAGDAYAKHMSRRRRNETSACAHRSDSVRVQWTSGVSRASGVVSRRCRRLTASNCAIAIGEKKSVREDPRARRLITAGGGGGEMWGLRASNRRLGRNISHMTAVVMGGLGEGIAMGSTWWWQLTGGWVVSIDRDSGTALPPGRRATC